MKQVTDYPEQVTSDYLQFQRESGTLESWLAAQAAIEALQAPVEEAAEEAVEEAEEPAEGEVKERPKAKAKPKEVKRKAPFRSQAQAELS